MPEALPGATWAYTGWRRSARERAPAARGNRRMNMGGVPRRGRDHTCGAGLPEGAGWTDGERELRRMTQKHVVAALLERAGRTYADDAGIRITDTPAPLYRLLVLSVLLSTRIKADIAMAAAAEMIRSGMGTPSR